MYACPHQAPLVASLLVRPLVLRESAAYLFAHPLARCLLARAIPSSLYAPFYRFLPRAHRLTSTRRVCSFSSINHRLTVYMFGSCYVSKLKNDSHFPVCQRCCTAQFDRVTLAKRECVFSALSLLCYTAH